VLKGDDQATYAAVGITFWPVRSSPEQRVAIGVRVDGLALHHTVTDRRMLATNPEASTWIPGVDVLGEIALRVSSSLDVVTSVGIESALGPVRLHIAGVTADTIPVLRGVGEFGIRISF